MPVMHCILQILLYYDYKVYDVLQKTMQNRKQHFLNKKAKLLCVVELTDPVVK